VSATLGRGAQILARPLSSRSTTQRHAGFDEGHNWIPRRVGVTAAQFPKLCEFSSGLITIYAGTMRVESDFSILGWERDEYHSALMDFSLEGIMHAKQFKALQSIA
jgi:hypothetical protein